MERPEEAEDKPWHRMYWRAWESLRFDRQFGALGGQSPISYLAISQYARDHDITGDDFGIFHVLMTAIDAEWLQYAEEQEKLRTKK